MQCNIDARGKAIRLVIGAMVAGFGLLLVTLGFVGAIDGTWPYIVGSVMVISGLFAMFEGLAGWCVVRAMGFRTPV